MDSDTSIGRSLYLRNPEKSAAQTSGRRSRRASRNCGAFLYRLMGNQARSQIKGVLHGTKFEHIALPDSEADMLTSLSATLMALAAIIAAAAKLVWSIRRKP